MKIAESISRIIRSTHLRQWSNDQLMFCSQRLNNYRTVINVSGWKDEDKEGNYYREYFKYAQEYFISNYPNDIQKGISNKNDIALDLNLDCPLELVGKFDLVINHTVLEHLPNPIHSFNQLAKLSSDLLITVVPWVQRLHFLDGQFGDFFRISPMMMRKLYLDNGFQLMYENFMPNFANECYLFYVGARHPERHSNIRFDIVNINELNNKVGAVSFRGALINIFIRILSKFYKPLPIEIGNT